MHYKIVPDVVRDQNLAFANEATTVREAAQAMARRHIGAVMIVDQGRLIGIFTERDLLGRVVAAGLNPDATPLRDVMTRNPDTLESDDTALHALQLMRRSGYRHLPVVAGDKIIGMVSVRDLYGAVLKELEEDIRERDAFIHDTGYGVGADVKI
jgi:CBS domain-containing protein